MPYINSTIINKRSTVIKLYIYRNKYVIYLISVIKTMNYSNKILEFILQCKQANKDAPIRALLSIMTRDRKDKGRSLQYSSTRRLAFSNMFTIRCLFHSFS